MGDKLGFLEATIDFALKRKDLGNDFMEFLKTKMKSKELEVQDLGVLGEVALYIE